MLVDDVVVDDESPLSFESPLEEPEPVYAWGCCWSPTSRPSVWPGSGRAAWVSSPGPYQYRYERVPAATFAVALATGDPEQSVVAPVHKPSSSAPGSDATYSMP